MKRWILLILLIVLDLYLIYGTRDSPNMIEVKRRYKILRQHIKKNRNMIPEKFWLLSKPILLVGKESGELGYNSNKGFEIGLCLNGSPNDIFHVLLHELSHSTVDEYSHSEQFWKNFSELRDICSKINIYDKIPERKEFCGQFIQD
jgi:hypothetical protein